MKPPSIRLSRQFGLLAAAVLSLISTIPAEAWQLLQAPVMSPWAQLVDPAAPLPEYPRPQMTRSNWLNLNGIWQFKAGNVGDPVPTNQTLAGEILVPFPMESVISGVAAQHPRSWYRRQFVVPPAWSGQKILLHLEAVDWESEVFIDGVSCGIHRGGYDKMTYDITSKVTTAGPHEMIVRVYDPTDSAGYPRGKQTLDKALNDVIYTSCTGIWQTVWLEPVPQTSVEDLKLVPDIDNSRLNVTVTLAGATAGMTVTAVAKDGDTVVGTVTGAPNAVLQLSVPTPKLWSPSSPFLYNLEVTVSNGATQLDSVGSYFGMRKISLGTSGGFVKMLLNNQFTFQYGPLDQGFWPDGIYTAPTDDALKSDIEQAKILGCNMIRKHIKVESARWYYWADKLGMLVWQDMPSCNSYNSEAQPIDKPQFKAELTRMVDSRRNHPSIISWVIFNEGQGQHDTVELTNFLKTRDPSRLVNQASGWTDFGGGDVFDYHHYTDPVSPASATRAVVCGEYGGVGLPVANHIWGSGFEYTSVADSNALTAKFEEMSYQLSDFTANSGLSAAVYTQITDVESELNGFLTYDRQVRKPDADRIRASIAQASSGTPALMPSSQSVAQTWKYTTTTPASDWYASGFSDTAWTSAPGAFGTIGNRRTTWNTPDIWLRRTFNPGTLTASQLPNLRFSVFHDEAAEIYINGVLAATIGGNNSNYALFALTTAGQNAILSNATNVLAVHCHQTSGGQFIDVGLSLLQDAIAVPPRPVPTQPTTLLVKNGKFGPSLGWSAVPNATNYQIKRSLTSDGPYTNLLLSSPINAVIDTTATNGVTYYYVVSAMNASGESVNSAQIAVTAVVPPPPPVPQPTLAAWFKADALNSTDGALVPSWIDSSGSGNTATQAATASQPTYVTAAINGRPAVRFNAAESDNLAFTRPVKDNFAIFCVFRSTQGIGTGTNFYEGAGLVSGEKAGATNDFGLSLNANGKLLAGTGNPERTIASTGTTFKNGSAHVAVFKRTKATGSLELFADGVPQGTATGGVQSLTAPDSLILGSHPVLNNYLTGDIAEVKIYDGIMNDADRSAVSSALAYKYGIGPAVSARAPADFLVVPGNVRATLTWTPVMEANSYTVSRSATPDGPFTPIAQNLTSGTFVDLTATPGKNHYYKVTASNESGVGLSSDTFGVLVPMPVVGISADSSSVTVRWPDWASGWILNSSSDLQQGTWSPVLASPTTNGGVKELVIPVDSSMKFFRLASPTP
ncbi:MAG: Evolved beta-galactosidase subunit alpha [Verrucomicrobiota bacterium]|jgi:hypothetical protein